MHTRKRIRDNVVALLKGQNEYGLKTDCDNRVYGNRPSPLFNGEAPCILVYTPEQESEIQTDAPRNYENTTDVMVEILVAVEEGFDDQMDQIADQVETILFLHQYLPTPGTGEEVADDLVLASTSQDLVAEGQTNYGSTRIRWVAKWDQAGDMRRTLDNLESIKADWDIPPHNSDNEPDAVDEINLN